LNCSTKEYLTVGTVQNLTKEYLTVGTVQNLTKEYLTVGNSFVRF
jgi:hypothetical protein